MKYTNFLVWISLLLSGNLANAQESILKINNKDIFYFPGSYSSYLIDHENELNVSEISSPKYQSKFMANNTETPNFRLTSSTIWLRFKVLNLLDRSPYLEIINPALDTVEYFLFNKEGHLVHHHLTGNIVEVEDRVVRSEQIMFDMDLDTNSQYTCYLKINSKSSSIMAPIRIASLIKYYEATHNDSIWQGIYFGLILFLFVYNLFLFFSLKELTYLYFAFFIGCIGLLFVLFKGIGIQLLWSKYPYFYQYTALIGALAGIFMIMFTANFLNSRIKTPNLHTWLLALIGFYIMIIGLNLSGIQFISIKLLEYNSIVVLFFLMFVAVKAWKDGFVPSKYYLLAWSFFALGFTIFIFRENEWIVVNRINGNVLQISSTITILFMSFALSKKINIYIDKRNEAQSLALNTAIENEKLISNQNQLLEAKVNQRTEDLEQTIATLSKQRKDLHEANNFKDKIFSIISHDLKSPISTLAGLLKLMKTKSLNENEQGRVVDTLELALNSTKYLLDNILAWAYQNNQKEIDEIEVYALTEEIFHLFSYHAELKNIKLINGIEKGFHIESNKNMLQLVLRNLVSNAIKFTKKNGTIEISMQQDYLHFLLFVKDTGIGMTNEVISGLLKANNHMSTRGTENEKGTGLGLKLCKEFLDKYNGSLEVESKVGEGSTFTVKLKNAIPVLEKLFD